jgi:uncharacterized protein YbaP (TraB family)
MEKGRETGPFFSPDNPRAAPAFPAAILFKDRSPRAREAGPIGGGATIMNRISRKATVALALAAALSCGGPTLAQQQSPKPAADPQNGQVEEIVVTARRSGIPVWRVSGPATTVILVGSIQEVSKATKWEPGNLTSALRKADRVMFPQTLQLTASPFAMVGWMVKLARMANMPKGQSLREMMPAAEFNRLVSLERQGILKPGFERRHPLILALQLHDYADGKAGTGTDAEEYVRRAARKYKLQQVPFQKLKANKSINAVFKSEPREHVPCLVASIALAEAGSGAVQARSDAWAQRRIADVLASPAERAFQACDLDHYLESRPDWQGTLRRTFAEPQVTVAVLNLASLAARGGTLDQLAAAGFDVQGPDWRSR